MYKRRPTCSVNGLIECEGMVQIVILILEMTDLSHRDDELDVEKRSPVPKVAEASL